MNNSVSTAIPDVKVSEGRVITTSLAVAAYFQKCHDNVLDKIRAVMADCDTTWHLLNFKEISYIQENPNGGPDISTPMFELTRNAFDLIVIGFTGKKVRQWNIDYITAFDKMEEELRHQYTNLFPLNADMFVRLRDGKIVEVQQAQPGEMFMTVDASMEIAERAGYLVIHCDEFESLTISDLAKRASAARQLMHKWKKLIIR